MRMLFPARLIIVAAVAVAAIPELAKKCKPAARAVAEGLIKVGESLRDATRDIAETPSASAAPPQQSKARAAARPKTAAKAPRKSGATASGAKSTRSRKTASQSKAKLKPNA